MTPPAEMKLPLRLDTVHEDLIVDAENCVCFRVVGQSKWPPIILGAVNRHAELVEALKGLMALVNMHDGHGTPSFSNDRVAIYFAMMNAEKALTEPTK